MIINENDIREIIRESMVNSINEYHHVINSSLEELAEKIIDLAGFGGGTIGSQYINKINKYFNTNSNIIVGLAPSNYNANAAISKNDDGDVIVTIREDLVNSKYLKSIVMHELSHFIDLNRRTKIDTDLLQSTDLYVSRALYVFRRTELQARAVQYSYFLKENPAYIDKPLTYGLLKNMLKINEMKNYIKELKSAKYVDHYMYDSNSFKYDFARKMIFAYNMMRLGRRYNTTEFKDVFWRSDEDYLSPMSKEVFEKRRDSLVKKFEKMYNEYLKKLLKIKYDTKVSRNNI